MTAVERAFVPGHATGFFTIDEAAEPTAMGSRGGGISVAEGVTVTVRDAETPDVLLNGQSVEMGAVARVLETLDAAVEVRGMTELPIAAGFGVSGAMALGTALATNALLGRALSERELVTIAHGAEVQAGTGLGDVVAQARGGIPIRLEPGGPYHNVMDGIPARPRVEYLSLGKLDTESVLETAGDALTAAGEASLSQVVAEPTIETFMTASRRFAREVGLLTDGIRDVLEAVAENGGEATMAMLGETVVAVGTGLTDAGYDPVVTRTHPGGATLEPPP